MFVFFIKFIIIVLEHLHQWFLIKFLKLRNHFLFLFFIGAHPGGKWGSLSYDTVPYSFLSLVIGEPLSSSSSLSSTHTRSWILMLLHLPQLSSNCKVHPLQSKPIVPFSKFSKEHQWNELNSKDMKPKPQLRDVTKDAVICTSSIPKQKSFKTLNKVN